METITKLQNEIKEDEDQLQDLITAMKEKQQQVNQKQQQINQKKQQLEQLRKEQIQNMTHNERHNILQPIIDKCIEIIRDQLNGKIFYDYKSNCGKGEVLFRIDTSKNINHVFEIADNERKHVKWFKDMTIRKGQGLLLAKYPSETCLVKKLLSQEDLNNLDLFGYSILEIPTC